MVRPSAVDQLVARHEVLAGPVPAPPVLAATADGVVVLPGLPGTPLRALLSGGAGRLPHADELERVLDALPDAVATLSRQGRRAPADGLARAGTYAAVLGLVLPALRPRLDALTSTLDAADAGAHDPVPVHGDFYESQLLVDDGAVVGLLDVDTAGCGSRIDDWANLLAHLAVLEQVLPGPAPPCATAGRSRPPSSAGGRPRRCGHGCPRCSSGWPPAPSGSSSRAGRR
ncbi:phosphotransferase [Blastococcus brunescens]|uniref:Phosphotransferase n=1 Tax=Blastococcus brunescens TaxID=1564165 RepID=A0ABZ1B2V1_9ACTN|nr:phosphotransferase [Blastococcus sp. BMG 8361]WRL65128.1 phosphotransferase [Blastococcus sp. BMG 8361]